MYILSTFGQEWSEHFKLVPFNAICSLLINLTLLIMSKAVDKSVAIMAVMSVNFIGNVCKHCVSAGVLSVLSDS